MGFASREHADVRHDVCGDMGNDAGLRVADDEHVEVQRLERVHGIEHRLAFGTRGQLDFEVHHIRAEPASGELE